MRIYGYARISTAKQSKNENLLIRTDKIQQWRNLRNELDDMLKAVNADVKAGKPVTVVFYSVSRMSRNAAEGVKLYMDLYDKGVNLVFLKDSYINTDLYRDAIEQTIPTTGNEIADIYIEATNKVLKLLAKKQIEQAFKEAEDEVNNLHQRTADGMKASGATNIKDENGNIIERGKISMARQDQRYHSAKEYKAKIDMLMSAKSITGNSQHHNDRELMERLNIAKNTYYRYKAELKKELAETDARSLLARYKALLKDREATAKK